MTTKCYQSGTVTGSAPALEDNASANLLSAPAHQYISRPVAALLWVLHWCAGAQLLGPWARVPPRQCHLLTLQKATAGALV